MTEPLIDNYLAKLNFDFWRKRIIKEWQDKLTTQDAFITDYKVSKDVILKIAESYINVIDLLNFGLFYLKNYVEPIAEKVLPREDIKNITFILNYYNKLINYDRVCVLLYEIKEGKSLKGIINLFELKSIFSNNMVNVKKFIDFGEKLRYREKFIKRRIPGMIGARVSDKEEIEGELFKNMPSEEEVSRLIDEEREKGKTDDIIEKDETVVEFEE